jgi:hypothetical protein
MQNVIVHLQTQRASFITHPFKCGIRKARFIFSTIPVFVVSAVAAHP